MSKLTGLISEIESVVDTGILPDGDHPSQPVLMWLKNLLDRYGEGNGDCKHHITHINSDSFEVCSDCGEVVTWQPTEED